MFCLTGELECCPGCTIKVSVTSIEDIKRGDHICYRPSWYSPYIHHAIVENVNVDKKKLDLIHFTRLDGNVSRSFFGNNFKIQKSGETVWKMNCLNVVKYPYGRYSPDETIDNATKEMNKGDEVTYNICTYNCEHLCYKSTVGIESSKQVQSCFRICGLSAQSLSIIVAWLFQYFAKFILIPIIDINPVIAERITIALFTFVSILLLLYCILKPSPCCKNENEACKNCCPKRCDLCIKRHNYVRWIRFLSFVGLQLPSLFLEIHFIRKGNRQAAVLLTGLAFLFVTLFTISKVPKAVRFCLTKGYKFSHVSNVKGIQTQMSFN
jgi:hypothetical protein